MLPDRRAPFKAAARLFGRPVQENHMQLENQAANTQSSWDKLSIVLQRASGARTQRDPCFPPLIAPWSL